MEKIINQMEQIYSIIGYQEYIPEKNYSLNTYTLKEIIGNDILIYNLITRELLLFNQKEYSNLCANREEYEYLIKHWFLTPDNADDRSICYLFKQSYKNKYRRKHLDKIFTYIILTTTNCNARCWYCYQNRCSRRDMTEKTAKDVVEFIKKTTAGKAFIHWFGGEPLYNSGVIDLISNELKKEKIPYISTMTSNGYLINEHEIDKIYNLWHLDKIQITLDGMKETYNKTKNYIYSGNAFERVINNIDYLLKGKINMLVRLNLSDDNSEEMISLIDLLYSKFHDFNNLLVYAHPLFEQQNNKSSDLYEKYNIIQNYIWSKGFGRNYNLHQKRVTNCMSDNMETVVITPDGNLTLCEHHTDDEYIGNIYDNKINEQIINEWKKPYYIPECDNCILYPQCTKIKKCPVSRCTEQERNYTEKQIRQSILIAYQKYKKEQGNKYG